MSTAEKLLVTTRKIIIVNKISINGTRLILGFSSPKTFFLYDLMSIAILTTYCLNLLSVISAFTLHFSKMILEILLSNILGLNETLIFA